MRDAEIKEISNPQGIKGNINSMLFILNIELSGMITQLDKELGSALIE